MHVYNIYTPVYLLTYVTLFTFNIRGFALPERFRKISLTLRETKKETSLRCITAESTYMGKYNIISHQHNNIKPVDRRAQPNILCIILRRRVHVQCASIRPVRQ